MTLFNCTPEELAKHFVENPKFYDEGVNFFNYAKGRKILNGDLEKTLSADLDIFQKAHNIATQAEWFGFYVYDSWADNQGIPSEGVELYQKVGDQLVRKLGVDENGAPQVERAVEFLRKNNIKKINTINPTLEGYCGIKYSYTDGDGDVIQRKALDDFYIPGFIHNGIEVKVLNTLYV